MFFIKKRVIPTILAIGLFVVSICMLSSCGRAPKTEEVYDRVVELVEASYELNTLFYGAGIPVYERGSFYADFMGTYAGDSYATKGYEKASDHSMFLSEDDIQNAAELVYSKAYLEDVIYPACFVGYAIDNGMGDTSFAFAKYLDDGTTLYMSQTAQIYYTDLRIYDYSTMKVVAPSNSKACYVEIDSYFASEPEKITTDRIRLVKQEDGQWYLDSFTG